MTRLTARSSTIFIASGQKTRIYRSMEAVPSDLRRKLHESTQGLNSATILIADKRGREELIRALQGQGGGEDGTLTLPRSARKRSTKRPFFSGSVRTWIELLLPVGIAGALWAFISIKP